MTVAQIDERIPKYRHRGLFTDANLLLLYLIGEIDPQLVPRFKRTQRFNTEEFFLLKAITEFFPTVVTIPGVLTEVSNLAGHLDGSKRIRFYANFAEHIQLMKEEHVPSSQAAGTAIFQKLGLTDSAIILTCKDKYLALSADFLLTRFMEDNQLDVINFNHIRSLRLS